MNQNANNAIQKSHELVINAFRRYESLLTRDAVVYLNQLTDNFESIKADSVPLVKGKYKIDLFLFFRISFMNITSSCSLPEFSTKFSDDMLREADDLIKDADSFLDNKNLTDSLDKDVTAIKNDLLTLKDLNLDELSEKIDEIVDSLSITDSFKQLNSELDQFKQMISGLNRTGEFEIMLKIFIESHLDTAIYQLNDVKNLLAKDHSVAISTARDVKHSL